MSGLTRATALYGSGGAAIYNNTWGHYAPLKNTSYKGVVTFIFTEHSQYGCQAIIIDYDFPNLTGPYIHDFLFEKILDLDSKEFDKGVVYKMHLTFRNYRFYYSNPVRVVQVNQYY